MTYEEATKKCSELEKKIKEKDKSIEDTELEDGLKLSYEDFLNNPMRAER